MKELTSIEAIKDKVINSNGTLICHWTVKTGIFGGIDDNADHYIEMLKEQFDEATYIPELESEEDYILMTFCLWTLLNIEENYSKIIYEIFS